MKIAKKLLYIFTTTVLLMTLLIMPATAAPVYATPTQSPVFVNGSARHFDAYFINGNNYFKLRDIAYVLNGTDKQFEILYDNDTRQIDLISHTVYTAVGSEMTPAGTTDKEDATPTFSEVFLNGTRLTLTAYFIGGSNYFKLRDIADAIDFGVQYIAERNAIEIDTALGYTPDKLALPSDLNVTMIGDSIGIGITPYLQKHFPQIYVDAKVSRQFSAAKSIIQGLNDAGQLGPVVIIELGSNGTIRASDMRAVISLIGSDKKIVFVNNQLPRSWCTGNNETLETVCAEYPNTCIANWYEASINETSYFYKDGVHPNSTGATAMAKLIADTVVEIY